MPSVWGVPALSQRALGQRLSELAILLTARHWSQPVEWAIHAPIAREKGSLPRRCRRLRKAPARGSRPDEQTVYDFCQQLHQQQKVSDETGSKPLSYGARRAWWI